VTAPPSQRDLVDLSDELVKPVEFSVDGSLDEERARHMVHIAQLLYTFWDSGDERFLRQAVESSFMDNTLPPDRPQGVAGVEAASRTFRTAVPDLTCELSDLLVVGEKLSVRLRFRGHFTGYLNGTQGSGQDIDFVAFDIQHVGAHRIVEDWHLEDNLTFLRQAGLVTFS
jgi:predicted ester cyclase